MRRSGGPFDQPGGCSFKTYVRAEKLRAKAEPCVSFAQLFGKQVIGNKSVTKPFFGKNIFREFFSERENKGFRRAKGLLGAGGARGIVLGKLIHEIPGFSEEIGGAEASK